MLSKPLNKNSTVVQNYCQSIFRMKLIAILISDHQNWFGIDENLGPVAVSIRRERVPSSPELVSSVTHAQVLLNTDHHLTFP